MILSLLIPLLTLFGFLIQAQDLCPTPNNYSYHTSTPQTIRSFQGIYHSNFHETITFCNFKPKNFEVQKVPPKDLYIQNPTKRQFKLNSWKIIPVLAQTAYGAPPYTSVGAVLTGSVYIASNGSIIWNGFGFSATGPYNCAFALSSNGSTADGYYTYTDQKNGSSPAGETGAWLLQYYREPTWGECALVYRGYTARDYEIGCTASSE